MGSDFTPPILKMPHVMPQELPKRSSQLDDQGMGEQGKGGTQIRKAVKVPSMSIMRQDLPEDPLRAASRLSSNTIPVRYKSLVYRVLVLFSS